MLTRLAFFKWLAAAVGLQEPVHTLVGGLKGWQDTCVTTHGFPRPCEAKEGWEECPVGHYQKPRRTERMAELGHFWGVWMEPKVCAVCGVVYVPQQAKEK